MKLEDAPTLLLALRQVLMLAINAKPCRKAGFFWYYCNSIVAMQSNKAHQLHIGTPCFTPP